MARTPYQDADAEDQYAKISGESTKPSAPDADFEDQYMKQQSDDNYAKIKHTPRRRGRPAIGNGNED